MGSNSVKYEVHTSISESIEIDDLDQPPNIPKGRHKVVALTTD